MTRKQIKESQTRLETFDAFQKLQESISEGRNKLEAYAFGMRDRLENSRDDLLKVALEEQIDNALAVLDEASRWLENDGADLAEAAYLNEKAREKGNGKARKEDVEAAAQDALELLKAKLAEAEAACLQLDLKLRERTAWPMAAGKLRKMAEKMKEKEDEAVAAELMNEEEADAMEAMLNELLDWLNQAEKERKSLPKGADLKTTSAEVTERMADAEKKATEMLKNSEKRTKLEKFEKERAEREAKKRKEKEKLLKLKKLKEEKKKKKMKEEGGYEELLQREEEEEEERENELKKKNKKVKAKEVEEEEEDDDEEDL